MLSSGATLKADRSDETEVRERMKVQLWNPASAGSQDRHEPGSRCVDHGELRCPEKDQ